MSKFRFYDPKLSGMLDFELIEGLRPPSLYQPTTQEENVRRRYESLRRADRGTSPLRMELYDFLYGTGPTDEQLQYNPNDPQTSLLALRSMAQGGGALDALDAAAKERNTAGSEYTSASADSAVGGPVETFDYDLRRKGADLLTREGRDILTGRGTFDPNRIPEGAPDLSDSAGTVSPASNIFQMTPEQLDELDKKLREQGLVGSVVPPAVRPDPVQGDNSDTDKVSAVTTNPAPQSVTNQAPTGQEPTTEEGQSRIRSILSMLGDNPELLSALGILGQGVGGYMQSRAQDKANRRANQEQRVNNAIAAFLDRPAEVAQADTATSKGGNILGALGAALGGYGQARMTQRAMDAESDEMRLDRESAERIARIKAGAAGSGDADGRAGDIANALASFDAYTGALDRAVDEGLGGEPYADFVLDIPILKRMFPEAQAAQPMFEAAALNIATAIQGSRPSEGDRIAFAMLMPQLSDSAAARQAKIRNIRELLNAAQGGQKFQEGWAQNMQGNTSQGGTDPLGLSGATAGDPLGLGG